MIFKKSHLTTQKIHHYGNLLKKLFRDWIPLYEKTCFEPKNVSKKSGRHFFHPSHHHQQQHSSLIISITHSLTTRCFGHIWKHPNDGGASCLPSSCSWPFWPHNGKLADQIRWETTDSLNFLGVKGWCYLRIFVNCLFSWISASFLFLPWLFLSCECGEDFFGGRWEWIIHIVPLKKMIVHWPSWKKL